MGTRNTATGGRSASSAGSAGATCFWGEVRKGGGAPLPSSLGLGRRDVELTAAPLELLRFLPQALRHGGRLVADPVGLRVLPHVLGDLHRAEVRAAHGAEVRELGALGGERLVVEAARRLRVEREVELVLPAELEARPRERVVPLARPRMALRDVGGVGGDLVGDDAVLDVLLV